MPRKSFINGDSWLHGDSGLEAAVASGSCSQFLGGFTF